MNILKPPDWLVDREGIKYYHQHATILQSNGMLNLLTHSAYSVLCDAFVDYRNATNPRDKNKSLDIWMKLAGKFGIIPDNVAIKQVASDAQEKAIDPNLARLISPK